MEGLFDPASYAALLAAMPDRRFYHDLRHRDALRKDGSSTRLRMYLYPERLRRLPPEQRKVWLPLARALCSKELEEAFKRKFRATLEERFGKPAEEIGVYPIPILLRDQPGYKISSPQRCPDQGHHGAILFADPTTLKSDVGTIFHENDADGAKAKKTRRRCRSHAQPA